MSVLAWLFGLGILSIAFPLFFHLIRRRPQGEMTFSSLMFLRSTPPRVSRKSRLENLLLLLLRCLAIALIAAAFMRPYFSDSGTLSVNDIAARRIVILVDRSASMQRSGLWEQAQKNVKLVVEGLDDRDEFAIYLFDDKVDVLVDFPSLGTTDVSNSGIAGGEINSPSRGMANRASAMEQRLRETAPSWRLSNIGSALTTTAQSLITWRDAQALEEARQDTKLQIVLISDLQKTDDLQSIQSFQWPEEVFVDLKLLSPASFDNATVQILQSKGDDDSLETAQSPSRRIRVTNSQASQSGQYIVNWFRGAKENAQSLSNSSTPGSADTQSRVPTQGEIPFFVPPGSSRILPLPDFAARGGNRFELVGDTHPYDNTFYVVPETPRTLQLLFVGPDNADDPESKLFYLKRAIPETENLKVRVQSIDATTSKNLLSEVDFGTPTPLESIAQAPENFENLKPSLIVISSPLDLQQQAEVSKFVEKGGVVLLVIDDSAKVTSLAKMAGLQVAVDEEAQPLEDADTADSKRNYSMWVDLKFNHWILQPFANPKYNDFTKIRFWQHPKLPPFADLTNIQMIASFDDNSPAIWQHQFPDPNSLGALVVMASGWQPSTSQFALSSKFVPFLGNLVQQADRFPKLGSGYLVGQPISVPSLGPDGRALEDAIVVTNPDGSTLNLEPGTLIDSQYPDTNLPGIYKIAAGGNNFQFAVNLDRRESESAMINLDQFSAFNVPLGFHSTAVEELGQLQQLKDVQLEDQQKVWKWLIVSAIVLLTIEAIVAAITARKPLAIVT